MSEVTPTGYENMIFDLFGVTNCAVSLLFPIFIKPQTSLRQRSSFTGSNIVQAIIKRSNNNRMGFPFLLALCTVVDVIIRFVDVEKVENDAENTSKTEDFIRASKKYGLITEHVVERVAS